MDNNLSHMTWAEVLKQWDHHQHTSTKVKPTTWEAPFVLYQWSWDLNMSYATRTSKKPSSLSTTLLAHHSPERQVQTVFFNCIFLRIMNIFLFHTIYPRLTIPQTALVCLDLQIFLHFLYKYQLWICWAKLNKKANLQQALTFLFRTAYGSVCQCV